VTRVDGERPVAAFDFDGTLTRRDSLLPFLMKVSSPALTVSALALSWARPPDAPGVDRRDRIKSRVLHRLLAGRNAAAFEAAGHHYASRLEERLRPSMVETLRSHEARGHETILVSASLAVYLRPLGQLLGIDAVHAVEMETIDGHLTGAMLGPNCRGPEKVARLRAWEAGRPASPLWAYGDSRGDRELLALSDHPTWMGLRGPR
jgi:phosphatidylglycerophosphatase C